MLVVTIEILISLAGLIMSIAAMIFAFLGDARKLEHRLTSLESDRVDPSKIAVLEARIEPIWLAITQQIPRLIISDSTPELDELIEKKLKGNSPLTEAQDRRLMDLLDGEYILAEKAGNTSRAVAIALYRASLGVNV
ncbi:unnamed protein product [marine sediment metagenome]|uniref:Uncharacterized protein n=1 Tax=marine sediment metagenome TaxID=412755 RepID=X0WBL8_9ZZZZ